MNNIRNARMSDIYEIQDLLEQLGFPTSVELLENNLNKMLSDNNYIVLVYEQEGKAVALMTIHFYYQIAFKGETATIGFFVVDERMRGKRIGKKMEEYCTQLAYDRNCDVVEVYSSEKRKDAHRFYERQGYKAYEKFFIKEIAQKA